MRQTEREAEEGEHLSLNSSLDLAVSAVSRPPPRYGTKQKDAPECDISNGTLMSALLRS